MSTTNIFQKTIETVKNNAKYIIVLAFVVLCCITVRQCENAKRQKAENERLENNLLAVNDTLKNYKQGKYNIAEMLAMQLRIEELADSLKMERGKTPVTIIKYVASVSDSMEIPVAIVHDTVYLDKEWADKGWITANDVTIFGNSSREISMSIPYRVDCETGVLESDGKADIGIEQDIWVESVLYRDKKGFTYIRLKTDYPGCTFNNGTGILITDKSYEYKSRKQFGLGIGLQVGYGATLSKPVKMSPYIGIGLSLNWNPRFLQF